MITLLAHCPVSAQGLHGSPEHPLPDNSSSNTAHKELAWNHDMTLAIRKAQQRHKYILVDIYTDWCGWCKKLDRDTYTAPAVTEYLKQFVLLKIDAEDGKEGQAFSKQQQIGAFPCIAVLDSNGNLTGKLYGFRSAAEFPAAIDELLPKSSTPKVTGSTAAPGN